jgi:hypothetical protein
MLLTIFLTAPVNVNVSVSVSVSHLVFSLDARLFH